MLIYGVIEKFNGNIEVRSAQVIKETAKMYWLEQSIEWYNYRKSIEKDSSKLHLTAKDALESYLENKEKQIEFAQRKLDTRLTQRDNARELLANLS